ncbi:MAG: RICIN domain-containing protein [Lachnospiraceae bacterium]|nr:RICIN domain-containing protein [Lachnospiraceae bacterium]
MKGKFVLIIAVMLVFFGFRAAQTVSADGMLASGTYVIRSALGEDRALDISGASKKSGGNLQLYALNGSAAQQFTLTRLRDGSYEISPVCSALALDVQNAAAANGNNVRQYAPNGTSAQRWSLAAAGDGTYSISPACAPGFSLDVSGGSRRNGANLQIYKSNGTAAQRFSFEMVDGGRIAPDGCFTFLSALDASKVIDVAGGKTGNGANIQLYSSNTTAAQQFTLEYLGGGWYTILNVKAEKALDVRGGSQADCANIQLYASNKTRAQRWRFQDNGDGSFVILSALGKALDIAGGSARNGTNIRTYTANGTKAQSFSFLPVNAAETIYDASAVLSKPAGTVLSEKSIDWKNPASYFKIYEIHAGDEVYNRIIGKSYRENNDISLSRLRYLKMLHYNFKGQVQVGEMITNQAIAADIIDIFFNLFKSRYQINSMYLVDRYWTGDGVAADSASVLADNTSCFNYRKASDADNLSRHAFGMAVDLNPFENPYVYVYADGRLVSGSASAQEYAVNRSADRAHVMTGSDLAVRLFKEHGFSWGGDWGGPYDYQHFVK